MVSTRASTRRYQELVRKRDALRRVARRYSGERRGSMRLAVRRWAAMRDYTWENPRDLARFNGRMADFIWRRIGDGADASADNRFNRRSLRLMARYPAIVDSSPYLREALALIRDMNAIDGRSQRRVNAVYRQMGQSRYYRL
jgi:hypothetical protein